MAVKCIFFFLQLEISSKSASEVNRVGAADPACFRSREVLGTDVRSVKFVVFKANFVAA